MPIFKRKKIGLALSSGGSRGIAHIGVLEILEKNNIPIDMISGTSMGALIGALYSINTNAKKIKLEALKLKDKKLFDYTFSRHGLIKGKKIEKVLDNAIGDIKFKDLKIPLYVTSFDLENNREIIFHRGSVAKAVRASISIPGIFIPVVNNGKILVDGAVVDPIPTEILREKGADIVIAVNVNYMKHKKPIINAEAIKKQGKKKLPSLFQTAWKSIHVRENELSEADLFGSKADFVINVDLENVDGFNFSETEEIISKGKIAAQRSLKKIRNIGEHPLKEFLESLKEDLGVEELVKEVKKVGKKLEE